MTQDRPDPPAGSNMPEYTVSELSTALKRTVEDRYGHVRVRGEISQPKRHPSGHTYLRLKDDSAVLDAVIWRGVASRIALSPDEGLEVVCTGRLTTYAPRSQYQLVIEAMEVAGEGALLKLLEDRRKRLAAEGLFDAARKRPLPLLPDVIGVVTSASGAVFRDILHRLADRFPCHVLLWPVAVQGEGAAAQIAEAVTGFDTLTPAPGVPRPDLLIVARGGGSLEDLMAFNEEAVVRAVAACTIPVISAVGHETDTTLIDHAADHRAPTPSAAAERAVPVRADLLATVADYEQRRRRAIARLFETRRLKLDGLARGLPDPVRLMETATQRLDDRSERLFGAVRTLLERRAGQVRERAARIPHPALGLREMARRLDQARARLLDAGGQTMMRAGRAHAAAANRLGRAPLDRRIARGTDTLAALDERLGRAAARLVDAAGRRAAAAGQLLDSYSYENVLARGYVVVRDAADRPVTGPDGLSAGQEVQLQFAGDRRVPATVTGDKPAKKAKPAAPPSRQGKLF
ncbi:MAG: exodeoxyribonuclease VII large subunit [Rhodospirillaceae bacterium]|nr:exodeoxyribonuclease VII large subunit [Rhodospirillaceae bacterium]